MKEYEAYCTACGTRVIVTLASEPDGPIDLSGVDCLDKVVSCEKLECPIADITADNLPDRLEFLPAGLRGGSERGLDESTELVKRARATSVRIQTERATRRQTEGDA